MEIKVKNYRGDLVTIHLPLVERLYEGVFDSRGKQIMKYYDRTGKEDYFKFLRGYSPEGVIKLAKRIIELSGE